MQCSLDVSVVMLFAALAYNASVVYSIPPTVTELVMEYRTRLRIEEQAAAAGTRQGPTTNDTLLKKYQSLGADVFLVADCMNLPYHPLRIKAMFQFLDDRDRSHVMELTSLNRIKRIVQEVVAEYEQLFQVPLVLPTKYLTRSVSNLAKMCGLRDVTDATPMNADGDFDHSLIVTYKNRSDPRQTFANDEFFDMACKNDQTTAVAVPNDFYIAVFPETDCDPRQKRDSVFVPVASRIIICDRALTHGDDHYLKETIKHELMHGLGFTPMVCVYDMDQRLFHRRDIPFTTVSQSAVVNNETNATRTVNRPFLTFAGARTLTAARQHFDCPTLEGVPFEDDANGENPTPRDSIVPLIKRLFFCADFGGHWDEYYMGADLMVSTRIFGGAYFLSEITASYFEDAMMFRVNRSAAFLEEAESYWYGRGYGCDFVQHDCIHWIQHNKQSVTKFDDLIECSFPVLPSVAPFLDVSRAVDRGLIDAAVDCNATVEHRRYNEYHVSISCQSVCFNDSREPDACFQVGTYLHSERVKPTTVVATDTQYIFFEDDITRTNTKLLSRGYIAMKERCPMWHYELVDRAVVQGSFGRRSVRRCAPGV